MSARRGLLLACLAALAAAGCKRHWLYEWRDEPYIRPVFAKGEKAALARMRSMWVDDRDMGCRALSVMAREARATYGTLGESSAKACTDCKTCRVECPYGLPLHAKLADAHALLG